MILQRIPEEPNATIDDRVGSMKSEGRHRCLWGRCSIVYSILPLFCLFLLYHSSFHLEERDPQQTRLRDLGLHGEELLQVACFRASRDTETSRHGAGFDTKGYTKDMTTCKGIRCSRFKEPTHMWEFLANFNTIICHAVLVVCLTRTNHSRKE